jgi:hypothetical protein
MVLDDPDLQYEWYDMQDSKEGCVCCGTNEGTGIQLFCLEVQE